MPKQKTSDGTFVETKAEWELRLEILRSKTEAGGLTALAHEWDVDLNFLCAMLHGRRRVSEVVVAKLGLRRARIELFVPAGAKLLRGER